MTKKLELKKVKIDEHIRATKKGTVETPTARKRGRPRKDNVSNAGSGNVPAAAGASTPPSPTDTKPINQNQLNTPPSAIQPIYDTTEEAKGFLRAPFDIAAGVTGIQRLSLYPSQIDALAPSFKIVYDKRIAPYMGQNADLIAFGMVFAGILFEKVQVFKDESAKKNPPQQENKAPLAPFIPTEHHV